MPEKYFEGQEPLLLFKIPGNIEHVGSAVDRILKVVREASCVRGQEFEVEVALLEAVANAVKHGCKGDPCREVELRVLCDEDFGLLVIIRDPGEGFDPGEIPSPVEEKNLLRTHGRGVWLMNQMMDVVKYGEGGRKVILHKKARAPEEED